MIVASARRQASANAMFPQLTFTSMPNSGWPMPTRGTVRR